MKAKATHINGRRFELGGLKTGMGDALRWEDFVSAANDFLAKSADLNDGWEWVGIPGKTAPGESYLRKKELRAMEHGLTSWEYHVLYSPSYSAPVLYFNVSDPNGGVLGLDHVASRLSLPPGVVLGSHLSVVSQTEHPILRKPYCYLHPCHSADLLGPSEAGNVLVSWLSAVGPVVGLEMRLEYAKSVGQ